MYISKQKGGEKRDLRERVAERQHASRKNPKKKK